MSFAEPCDQLDIAMIPLGPGSKEKKAVFEAVVARLEAAARSWTIEAASSGGDR